MKVLDHETAAGAEAQEKPPAGHAVHVQRRHREIRRRAREDRHDAGPDADARGRGRELSQGRQRVFAPRLAHREAAVAELLGQDRRLPHLPPRHAWHVHAHEAHVTHRALLEISLFGAECTSARSGRLTCPQSRVRVLADTTTCSARRRPSRGWGPAGRGAPLVDRGARRRPSRGWGPASRGAIMNLGGWR